MKKIILLFVMAAFTCSLSHAQQDVWIDTLDLTEITATDTIIWKGDSISFTEFGGPWSLDVRYDSLDADDATFSIGGDNQGVGWNKLTIDSIPYTLDVTTNKDTINGNARVVKTFYGSYYPFITLGIRVNPGSVTTGSIIWKYIRQ